MAYVWKSVEGISDCLEPKSHSFMVLFPAGYELGKKWGESQIAKQEELEASI